MDNNSKKIAVIFNCSEAYAFALYVTLRSFFYKSPLLANMADIYVFGYKWNATTKKIISSCGPMTFVDYDLPSYVPKTIQIMRFTPALYARFEAFSLLATYDYVVCLDSDILVQKELKSCIDEVKGNIGITLDTLPAVSSNFYTNIPGYDMTAKCYNAGFLVLKRKDFPLAPTQIATWLYNMLAKHANEVKLGDQGLINLLFQEFKIVPYVFSKNWNLPASNPTRNLKQAFIVHSTGHRKFWCYYFFYDFYRYFSDWLSHGGEAISIRKNTKLWKTLLDKIGISRVAFFQLAPDLFKHPIKFCTFLVKYLLKIKY